MDYSCDRERIEQVLSILLDNALSYTPENGRVCLSLSETSGRITIRVADNGIGIPVFCLISRGFTHGGKAGEHKCQR